MCFMNNTCVHAWKWSCLDIYLSSNSSKEESISKTVSQTINILDLYGFLHNFIYLFVWDSLFNTNYIKSFIIVHNKINKGKVLQNNFKNTDQRVVVLHFLLLSYHFMKFHFNTFNKNVQTRKFTNGKSRGKLWSL